MRKTNPHAITLRRDMTRAELRIWFALRDRRLDGLKFRRQATLGPFIVDFLCAQARLVVEIDGGQHGGESDAHRDAHIEAMGYRIIRFWNNEVSQNFEGVLNAIHAAATQALTQPSPASGRGPVSPRPPRPPPQKALSRRRERVG
jgi:very-short-patch-repair endonuclease